MYPSPKGEAVQPHNICVKGENWFIKFPKSNDIGVEDKEAQWYQLLFLIG